MDGVELFCRREVLAREGDTDFERDFPYELRLDNDELLDVVLDDEYVEPELYDPLRRPGFEKRSFIGDLLRAHGSG